MQHAPENSKRAKLTRQTTIVVRAAAKAVTHRCAWTNAVRPGHNWMACAWPRWAVRLPESPFSPPGEKYLLIFAPQFGKFGAFKLPQAVQVPPHLWKRRRWHRSEEAPKALGRGYCLACESCGRHSSAGGASVPRSTMGCHRGEGCVHGAALLSAQTGRRSFLGSCVEWEGDCGTWKR